MVCIIAPKPRSLEDIVRGAGIPSPAEMILDRMECYFPDHIPLILMEFDATPTRIIYEARLLLPSACPNHRLMQSIVERFAKCGRVIILFGHRGSVPVALKRLTHEDEVKRLRYF
jgi:hypothetical protein